MQDKLIDVIDIASQNEQIATEKAIKQASIKANTLEVQPIGKCLNCDTEFETGSQLRFCDGECRDDWERMKRNG